MKLASILVAICPLLVPAAVLAQTASPTRASTNDAAVWSRRTTVATRAGARLDVAVAKSKTKDREVVVLVSPEGIESSAGLASMLQAMGSTVVAFELPKTDRDDALHAMITWASREFGTRVNVFGVGAGADLALSVGSRRTRDLWSIMVDGASEQSLVKYVPRLQKADQEFEGLLTFVDASKSESVMTIAKGSGVVQDLYVDGPRVSIDPTVVEAAQYKARIETFLFSERPELPPQDCLVCGPEESSAPRRVVVLDA